MTLSPRTTHRSPSSNSNGSGVLLAAAPWGLGFAGASWASEVCHRNVPARADTRTDSREKGGKKLFITYLQAANATARNRESGQSLPRRKHLDELCQENIQDDCSTQSKGQSSAAVRPGPLPQWPG